VISGLINQLHVTHICHETCTLSSVVAPSFGVCANVQELLVRDGSSVFLL
jgi:hypothetical protein